MVSSIPIFGLVHTVALNRYADADDGYGGIAKGAVSVIYTSIRCRVSKMTNEDEQKAYGSVSGRHWQVVMKYSPLIARSDFIVYDGQEYRVIYFHHQIDSNGKFHHTSVAMELEAADG